MTLTEVNVHECFDLSQALLQAFGCESAEARTVAEGLLDADLAGVASHGIGLLPMYLDRISLGSVRVGASDPVVVQDSMATAVIDAEHRLGQPVADFAMALAVDKAEEFGSGVVSVRHAFHFGAATRYVLQAADNNCVGIAMCNTRPLMPAPGGADRLVGNNPLAIGVPSRSSSPLILDFALSEAAMGKIRRAKDLGESIPDTWATDAKGQVTTDPAAAIEGMLLPVGQHKGFGLAFMIDLLVGGLSGGAWGSQVKPLYTDLSTPYDCSQLFLAIDVDHFGDPEEFLDLTTTAAHRVRNSNAVDTGQSLMTPGQPEWQRRQANTGSMSLPASVVEHLSNLARRQGLQVPASFNTPQETIH